MNNLWYGSKHLSLRQKNISNHAKTWLTRAQLPRNSRVQAIVFPVYVILFHHPEILIFFLYNVMDSSFSTLKFTLMKKISIYNFVFCHTNLIMLTPSLPFCLEWYLHKFRVEKDVFPPWMLFKISEVDAMHSLTLVPDLGRTSLQLPGAKSQWILWQAA